MTIGTTDKWAVGPDDEELVGLYRDGDAGAFETLFDRHHRSVYNFARYMTGDADEAQEVAQETFLAVARTARTYQPRGLFVAWLMRIVRNQCLHRLQSQSRRREHLTAQDDCPSPAADPAKQVQQAQEMHLVQAAILRLPQRQREAIILYAYQQMKYDEISHVLDMPVNTVKTLIHRARAQLARDLDHLNAKGKT